MVTKANRQRTRKKKPEHQADDVYVPSSIRKPEGAEMCNGCGRQRFFCECNQGRGKDPLGDLCGEPWHPVAIYLTAAAIAFAGGLGLGWAVWA